MNEQVELTQAQHVEIENGVATYLRNGLALYTSMRSEVHPSHVIIGLCKVLLYNIVQPLEQKDRAEGIRVVKEWLDAGLAELEANPDFQASIAKQRAAAS